MSNPFIASQAADAAVQSIEPAADPDELLGREVVRRGPQIPIETVPPPANPVLGRVRMGERSPLLWVVGTHGGAGASSVAAAITDADECERAWPMTTSPMNPPRVLLVARTHRRGLDTAANAVQEWASGAVSWTHLLGLLLVDDAPRVPPEVRPQIDQLLRATPHGWHLGWQPAWRHLPSHDRPLNRSARRTVHHITNLAETVSA